MGSARSGRSVISVKKKSVVEEEATSKGARALLQRAIRSSLSMTSPAFHLRNERHKKSSRKLMRETKAARSFERAGSSRSGCGGTSAPPKRVNYARNPKGSSRRTAPAESDSGRSGFARNIASEPSLRFAIDDDDSTTAEPRRGEEEAAPRKKSGASSSSSSMAAASDAAAGPPPDAGRRRPLDKLSPDPPGVVVAARAVRGVHSPRAYISGPGYGAHGRSVVFGDDVTCEPSTNGDNDAPDFNMSMNLEDVFDPGELLPVPPVVAPDETAMAARRRRPSRASRTMLDNAALMKSVSFHSLVRQERFRDWASSLRRLDPRFLILNFFDDVARDGGVQRGVSLRILRRLSDQSGCSAHRDSLGRGSDHSDGNPNPAVTASNFHGSTSAVLNPELISPLMRMFSRSGVFTVWRPCSLDAIRAMMTGAATGKGLDVKGKSARRGVLSGYVPFVQIHEEGHKAKVARVPDGVRMRAFYGKEADRDAATAHLEMIAAERKASDDENDRERDGDNVDKSGDGGDDKQQFRPDWPGVCNIDTYARGEEDEAGNVNSKPCWGIECPQSLFWEALVLTRPIVRVRGSDLDTKRPSEPAFQDMNLRTVRIEPPPKKKMRKKKSKKKKKEEEGSLPAPVVWQPPNVGDGDPLDPRTLLVAYEERGRVLPVVSDFDCFTVGTRGVRYDRPLRPEQVGLLKWSVEQVGGILDEQQRRGSTKGPSDEKSPSWTALWLDVLKRAAESEPSGSGGGRAAHDVPIPRYGYGDGTSYSMLGRAAERIECGAVRHGAECFNYKFPQELDAEFLVVSDTLPGPVPWRYVSEPELRALMIRKVDDGFAFPLNPKWVVADPGWKGVYDRLVASRNENVRGAVDLWFPPSSGVRELIEDVCARHPRGFVGGGAGATTGVDRIRDGSEEDSECGTEAMDLAQLQLGRYLVIQRAKRKFMERSGRRLRAERSRRLADEATDEEQSNETEQHNGVSEGKA